MTDTGDVARSQNARFGESGFAPIEHGGLTVHMFYEFSPEAGERFTVRRVSQTSPRVQGVAVRLLGGCLRHGDVEAERLKFWFDTCPDILAVECVAVPDGGSVRISNMWRRPDGVDDEFTNSAGIVIEDMPELVTLTCSDGYGVEPTFGDLVLAVEHHPLDIEVRS